MSLRIRLRTDVTILVLCIPVLGLGACGSGDDPDWKELKKEVNYDHTKTEKEHPVTPPEPGHFFRSVEPQWRTKVVLLRHIKQTTWGMVKEPRKGMITGVAHEPCPAAQPPGPDQHHTEIRYFEGDQLRKITLFHPTGYLESETDLEGVNTYSRDLYPDGTIRRYEHSHNGKVVDGFSRSPDGRAVHHLVNGVGELVSYGYRGNPVRHLWHFGSDQSFMMKEYREGVCSQITFGIMESILQVEPKMESLLLCNEYETWTKGAGKRPMYQILRSSFPDGRIVPDAVPEKKDVREFPVRLGPRTNLLEEQIRSEWDAAYPRRRGAFIRRFGELLVGGGHTWEDLGVAFVRDGAPWPAQSVR